MLSEAFPLLGGSPDALRIEEGGNVQRILLVAGAVFIWGPGASGQQTSQKTEAASNAAPSIITPYRAAPAHTTPALKPAMTELSKVDWRFAHPKPDLLLSMNVGKIVRSPYLAQSLQESFNMTSDVDKAKLDLILKMVGTVERVQVSLRSTQVKNDPDYLILVTGNLDGMVRQMLTQQSQGAAVVSREVSPNAILFGKAGLIDQAVQRMSGTTTPYIASDLSSSDLWIAGDAGLLQGTTNGPLPPGVDALKRFALGLNFGDPLELNANLSMANEDGAEKMVAMYNLLTAQAAQSPEAAALASAAKIDHQGSEVHFRFSAPLSMLQSQMKSASQGTGAAGLGAGQLPALLGMLGMSQPASPAVAPAAPATPSPVVAPAPIPQPPGKIMIYGLDDGPREVGTKHQ